MFKLQVASAAQAHELIPRAWIPQQLLTYYSYNKLTQQRTRYFTPDTTERITLEFGANYRDSLSPLIKEQLNYTPTQDAQNWANRLFSIIDTDTMYQALAGIRYRGQDINRPFIDVIATDIPCTAAYIASLAQSLLGQYKTFRPISVRFFVPNEVNQLIHDLRSMPGSQETVVDMHLVAGSLANLTEHPLPENFDRVTLLPLSPDEASTASYEAQRIYKSLIGTNPKIFEWATPQGKDSFEDTARQGTCWRVLVDDNPAGFLALDLRGEQGLTGFSVEELCLDAPFHGRKLGNAVLRHGIESVLKLPSATPTDMLWGTIHNHNTPSLRNALGIGRAVVGSYIWVGDQSF